MEVNTRYGNILIMAKDLHMDDFFIDMTSDFFVDSSFSRDVTIGYIMQILRIVSTLKTPLTKVREQRILISLEFDEFNELQCYFETPVDLKQFRHILKRVVDLLKDQSSDIKFFCPTE